MFDVPITRTAFTTQAANQYFSGKIVGTPCLDDSSAIATLRALLCGRIGDNQLSVIYYQHAVNRRRFNDDSKESLVRGLRQYLNEKDTFTIVSFCGMETANDLFDLADAHLAGRDGIVKLDPIRDFFRRNFDVLCFIREDYHTAVFFVKDINRKILHQLQIAAITALPWYFNPKNGDRLSDDEYELLKSLQEKTHHHYIACLDKIASHFDFEEKYLREKLRNMETQYERERIERVRGEIESNMDRINSYQDAIQQILAEMVQQNSELNGLQLKLNSGDGGDSPLLEFFLHNRNLRLDTVSGSRIRYYVKTYLQHFDESTARNMINNRHSVMYSYIGDIPLEVARKVMTTLFLDRKVRLRFCAAYQLSMPTGFGACSGFRFDEEAFDRMPNPHIQYYSCIGGYTQSINECLRARDYIGVVAQSMASASSLSLHDGVVIDRFFSDLWRNYDTRWFEFDDGRQVNLRELVSWIEKEKEQEEQENEQNS